MFDTFRDENGIKVIASSLPKRLVNQFDKKEYYSSNEVESIFSEVFDSRANIEYAYAMFCSAKEYKILAQEMACSASYSQLRQKIADQCFDGWPRFNFDSILNLTSDSSRSDLVNEITDIGLDLLGGS